MPEHSRASLQSPSGVLTAPGIHLSISETYTAAHLSTWGLTAREENLSISENSTADTTSLSELGPAAVAMADGYWNRQAPIRASGSASAIADDYWNQQQPLNPTAAFLPKRPRPDHDLPVGAPSGHELHNYLTRVDDHTRSHSLKDTNYIGVSYDRYLQNSKLSSFGAAEAISNFGGTGLGTGVGGTPGLSIGEPARMGYPGSVGSNVASNVRNMGYDGQAPLDPMVRPSHETPIPPNATCTLFVEGLPPDSTHREVAHIFRPFVGFKELRLVNREPKYRGGGPLILCFVDFTTPGYAASALGAVQGYKFDEDDPDSPILRVQFARFPSRKSGPPHNKR